MTIVSRLAVALAGLGLLVGPAIAEDASRWQQGFHSRARLLSGGNDLAGVEIVLDEEFKTYWRQPGESGLPPRFDWSGSENLAAADLHWPTPSRTKDAAGVAYTYAENVIFPVSITAVDPAKPVKLRLVVEYGACKDICIPARAEMSLVLAGRSRKRPVIEQALARVPRKRPLGAEGPLAILAAEIAPGEKPTYTIRVRAPAEADLFAEGPENWYLSTSLPHGDRFTVTVEDRPKNSGAASLRLTLAGGGEAIETEIHLDDSLRPR